MQPFTYSFPCYCAGLVVVLVLFILPMRAQEATGRVMGDVTDPSGLLVPRAKVTVTNAETGVSSETTTGTETDDSPVHVAPPAARRSAPPGPGT
jgi:hypothetical protein